MKKVSTKKTALTLSVSTAIVLATAASAMASERVSFNSQMVDASEFGNIEKLNYLLQGGVNPDERGDFGTTSLIRASYHGSVEMAEMLLIHGANPNIADIGGATPLHIAARENHAGLAKLLINYGADVNIADNEGNTPLMRASSMGNSQIVASLVSKGAKVNNSNDFGETALHYAAEANDEEAVTVLAQNGAVKNIVNQEGYTPSQIAEVKSNNMMIASLATAPKADPNHIELVMGKGHGFSKDEQLIAYIDEPLTHAPRINSKEVLKRLRDENKVDLAYAIPSETKPHDWLNGLKDVFEAAGAFELAAVKNYQEGEKYILLNLGSFKDRAFAERKISDIKSKHAAEFKTLGLTIIEKGGAFDVSAGIISDKAEALSICKKLAAAGTNCRPVETTLITAKQFAQFSPTNNIAPAPKLDVKSNIGTEPKVKSSSPRIPQENRKIARAVETPKVEAKTLDDVFEEIEAEQKAPKATPAPVKVKPEEIKLADTSQEEAPKSLDEIAGMDVPKRAVEPSVKPPVKIAPEPVKIAQPVKVTPTPEAQIAKLKPIRTAELEPEPVKVTAPKPVKIAQPQPVKVAPPPPVRIAQPKPTPPAPAPVAKQPAQPQEIIIGEDQRPTNIGGYATTLAGTKPTPTTSSQEGFDIKNYVRPQPARSQAQNKLKSLPPLVGKQSNSQAVARVAPAAQGQVVVVEPKTVARAKPSRESVEGVDKFKVSRPVKVKNDVYSPAIVEIPQEKVSAPIDFDPESYVSPLTRVRNQRWVTVDYFETLSTARGFWGAVKGNAPQGVGFKASRGLLNQYHSALIGPFNDDESALNFCESIAPENLRCSIQKRTLQSNRMSSRAGNTKHRHGKYAGTSFDVIARDVNMVASNITGNFALQFGTYGSRREAESAWNQVKGISKSIGSLDYKIIKVATSSRSHNKYRLRAGSFNDRLTAQDKCSAVKSQIFSCIIVRE